MRSWEIDDDQIVQGLRGPGKEFGFEPECDK